MDVDFAIEAVKNSSMSIKTGCRKQTHLNVYPPFVIATDAHLGVRASSNYLFAIILSPSLPITRGNGPVKIYVRG
jgi:branched-subunit amino acid aminotransferase/4-amino-4-deoxychorismate lyase